MASPNTWIYDVFLSFHGQDTRNNFISHLYCALKNANINTFIDSNIPRGDNISSSCFQAIETSRIAIIVLSPNFASSAWCLDEVVKILECRRSRDQQVLPVFFHVDPSDIQKQTGSFLAMLEENFRDNLPKVERWRWVLCEVADILGWHISSTVVEAEIIRQIVAAVSHELLKSRA